MNLTTKQYLEEKSYRSYAFVVKGKTSGMYIDINGLFERDIEQAQAFSSYDDAMAYIKGSKYPSLLSPAKYTPDADDDNDIDAEDADNPNPQEMAMEDKYMISRGK